MIRICTSHEYIILTLLWHYHGEVTLPWQTKELDIHGNVTHGNVKLEVMFGLREHGYHFETHVLQSCQIRHYPFTKNYDIYFSHLFQE